MICVIPKCQLQKQLSKWQPCLSFNDSWHQTHKVVCSLVNDRDLYWSFFVHLSKNTWKHQVLVLNSGRCTSWYIAAPTSKACRKEGSGDVFLLGIYASAGHQKQGHFLCQTLRNGKTPNLNISRRTSVISCRMHRTYRNISNIMQDFSRCTIKINQIPKFG